VLIHYNDSLKIAADVDLRQYWVNHAQQPELERRNSAHYQRLTEQVRGINARMTARFGQLRKAIISTLADREREEFNRLLGD
jgi:hypothetical protein